MKLVRPGSHVYRLLQLLSISGEFPTGSLDILGNERAVKAMVHRMEAVQDIKLESDGSILKTKLFQVSGKGDNRTVRLTKTALSVLNEIHPNALSHYLASFPNNRFTGARYRIWRNHRVAEAVAMCMMAGIQVEPYRLSDLQKESIRHVIPEYPCYYIARNFKKIYEAELNKTIFTRVIGLLFYSGGAYAAYNTRNAQMKWSGLGEIKARHELSEITRMNASLDEVQSAILFGATPEIALQTLIESDKTRKKQVRFDRIYSNIHFVPLNSDGLNLLKIITLPDWNKKLLTSLYNPKIHRQGHSSIEFDASINGTYFYSHLDSDIARLIRLRQTLLSEAHKYEVLCFPWQYRFLKEYLGVTVKLSCVEMPEVLKALGII